MFESPSTLEDLCLDTICDNIMIYAEPQRKTKEGLWERISSIEDYAGCEKRYVFHDPEIFLINEVSEKLLRKFCEKGYLCDATLNLFTENNTKLRNVKLKNCEVTKKGAHIFKQHKIVDLECINLKRISIGEIYDCLNEWSVENMTNVNFSYCSAIDANRHNFIIKISNLKNLRSLNLSNTELNQKMFKIICEDLKLLEKIDISNTQVTDLKPLTMLSSKLTSLSICDMAQVEHLVSTIEQLKLLKYLDISFYTEKVDSQTYNQNCPITEFLENQYILPDLMVLDVSGWKDLISQQVLLRFIETHPKLEFLGIVLCAVTFDPVFSDPTSTNYPHNLTIAGLGNEEHIKLTLKRHKGRSNYVQKALYHLFQLTSIFKEARPDIFNLVLPVMEAHSSRFGVQMAATACLYNLTRGDLSKNIHPKALSNGVNLTLLAMKTFPKEFQLQKNSLLTLCSDRILQEVNFDKFKCAKLVLDALCTFDDVNMNRMAVAICSILAAKVSTKQTSELGATPKYMRKLLAMVQSRVDTIVVDITLRFTLSALWNLTDESAATCAVFLEQGGAHLFLNVLRTFKGDSTIETKVLGLLNNIAEVVDLRHSLMLDSLMSELFHLLKSENIDVSYFAAGIVAHLASDGELRWTISNRKRGEMLLELENAVSQWKVPDNEMVAYRSFKPFFPLLRTDMDYQVQLWAVWAIHHVCTKNQLYIRPIL
ncbi:protein zyg-11 homolog B-like isoform X2 [Anoplophora glabripennis]|uniref:protein zyg-11 homolog B-like isoform X2 n=1 Tax=Anoplophora glabripennis TaxID=217634 RepID=UPI0008738BD6|nr:protein zyg-11 homolog B-like isoform X2 [Anoplophora glabripennis]